VSVKRRWKIAIATVALVAVAATVVVTTGDDEPKYKGCALSDWISDYEIQYDTTVHRDAAHHAATEALQKIGTNALPTLLKWMTYKTPAPRRCIERLLRPVAFKLGVTHKFESLINREEARSWHAGAVFSILGTNAAPALPQLSNMVVNPTHPHVGLNALNAIADTGTAGTKTLLALFQNPNNRYESETLVALEGCVWRDHDLIKQELTKVFENADPLIRLAASNALGTMEMLGDPRRPKNLLAFNIGLGIHSPFLNQTSFCSRPSAISPDCQFARSFKAPA